MAKQAACKTVWVASTVVATLLVAVLAHNLGLGDQQVDAPIEHAYSIEDPLFARTMGQALGADFVAGNRIDTLHNGEEIFPAMLEAIRSGPGTRSPWKATSSIPGRRRASSPTPCPRERTPGCARTCCWIGSGGRSMTM